MTDSPIKRAFDIVENRSEEKIRQYGDIDQSFERTAQLASILLKREVTAEECYTIMFCLKLSRETHAHKTDNMVDALAYLGALANYKEKHGV